MQQVRSYQWLGAANGALGLAQLRASCGERRCWRHPLVCARSRKADRARMIARDKQAHAGAWPWGARRTGQSPWCSERDALARIAAQHGTCNGNLFGQRRNALTHLAIRHAKRIVLGSITASANAECESCRGNRIECRRNLRD